jgi:hypothetical protein
MIARTDIPLQYYRDPLSINANNTYTYFFKQPYLIIEDNAFSYSIGISLLKLSEIDLIHNDITNYPTGFFPSLPSNSFYRNGNDDYILKFFFMKKDITPNFEINNSESFLLEFLIQLPIYTGLPFPNESSNPSQQRPIWLRLSKIGPSSLRSLSNSYNTNFPYFKLINTLPESYYTTLFEEMFFSLEKIAYSLLEYFKTTLDSFKGVKVLNSSQNFILYPDTYFFIYDYSNMALVAQGFKNFVEFNNSNDLNFTNTEIRNLNPANKIFYVLLLDTPNIDNIILPF